MDNMCEDRAMTAFAGDGRHRVAVLARDGMLSFEVSLVHRLFRQARSPAGEALYEVVTCAVEPGDIRTDADFTIAVAYGPEALAEADTVVVPGSDTDREPWNGLGGDTGGGADRGASPNGGPDGDPGGRPDNNPGGDPGGGPGGDPGGGPGGDPGGGPGDDPEGGTLDPALAAALARIRPGTRIASICTGSFVLAAAGLLTGRRATTHWRSSALFQKRFPDIAFDLGVLYTDDDGVLTSAGAASGIDLCLHMIRTDHGAAVANDVARGTVVPPHREGGQAQYVQRPVPDTRVSSTGRARAWALANLHRPVTLRELAAQESTSTRTFTRRFRDELGTSPGRWLTQQRIERARTLLERTDLPIDQVAADAGFGTAGSLRLHLQAELGVSPSAYRATFRGPAAPAG
jgi:transcriptional regulator GlxA family with amidase domain